MSTTWFYEPFYELDFVSPTERRIAGQGGDIAPRPIRPRMDLHENAQANKVTAITELPGVTKDQVNLEVQNGRLTVSGEVKKPEDFDEGSVTESDIKATMENGLLVLTFPKTTPEMAPKRINIL
ncbi:HSP20-like chaperone [Amanita muscaria]